MYTNRFISLLVAISLCGAVGAKTRPAATAHRYFCST